MAKGVRTDHIVIRSTDNKPVVDVVGALRYHIINKGEGTVKLDSYEVLESGDESCGPEIHDRVYCNNPTVSFATRSAAEYILVKRWYPVDDCCDTNT